MRYRFLKVQMNEGGQESKELFVIDGPCLAHNSETKAAIEKVNMCVCSTKQVVHNS
jgi:hypothetical protein